MNMTHEQQLQIQRCVDGEMTRGEQREFLRSLEHDPDAWKQLALTYVETQWLNDDLSHLAFGDDAPQPQSTESRTQTSAEPLAADPQPSVVTAELGVSQTVSAAHHELKASWKTVALAVACAALAITVGYQAGVRREPDAGLAGRFATRGETQLPLPDGSRSNPTDSGAVHAGPVHARPVMHLQIPAGSERSGQLEVPVFDLEDFNTATVAGDGSNLIPELQGLLNLPGYDVDRSRQLIHYQLDDGRQIAVPVETVQIRSRGL